MQNSISSDTATVYSKTSADYAQRALEHCKYLAVQIGPRPACQTGEREAARYARDVLQNAGIDNAREELLLSGRRTYRPFTLALLAGLGANLLSINAAKTGRVRRISAAIMAAFGAVGFAREANLQSNWMRKMLGSGDSQNVVGIVPARGEMHRRVVICAHLDSHRTPIFYSHPRWLKLFSRLIALAFGSLCLGAALHAASTCKNEIRQDRWSKAKKFAALIQTLAIGLTLQAESSPHTHGANDNASGAATMLALAERAANEPLENVEVWFVGTGCEEVGAYGMAALLRRHPVELRDAYFLNFDMCGIGSPALLTREGLLTKRDADAHLLALAHQVWAENPDLLGGTHVSDAYTDASIIAQNGGAALTIDAIIPSEHSAAPRLGYWHQTADQFQNIEFAALAKTQEFAWQMLQRISTACERS